MLGNAKGQILQIAACLQMFFSDTLNNHEDVHGEDDGIKTQP